VTWEDLFDRAAAYDVDEDDVRATVDAVRAADEHTESDGSDDTEADD
jgi:hypothetical protein